MRRVASPIVAALIAAAIACLAGNIAGEAIARNTSCSPACTARVKARELQAHYQAVWHSATAAVRAHLRRIAQCESGNNEHAISPGGTYRGLLQFLISTWRAMGGRGDPATATRWEQWARGVRLYLTAGPGQWPVCQYR